MTVVLVFLIVAAPCLATAVAYTHRWRSHSRDCESEPLPPAASTWAFARECATLLALALSSPLGLLRYGRADVVAASDVLVLVPGFLLSGAALWPLRRWFERMGWSVVVGTGLSWPFDVDARARRLEQCLTPLYAAGVRITLIAFGTGGWVARHYLQRHEHRGVERLLTIATWQQSADDAPAPRWGARDPHVAALMTGDRLPYELDVVAIYSDFDAIVPPRQAYYPGAFNIEIAGFGHLSLLTSHKVFELLTENLVRSPEAAGEPG